MEAEANTPSAAPVFEFQIPVINKTHRRPPNYPLGYIIPFEENAITHTLTYAHTTHTHLHTQMRWNQVDGGQVSCSFFIKCDRRRKMDFLTSFTKFVHLTHF